VRKLEKKLMATIKRALRLPFATDISYLVAPRHEMGLAWGD
jgi:hypothetical protein